MTNHEECDADAEVNVETKHMPNNTAMQTTTNGVEPQAGPGNINDMIDLAYNGCSNV